MTTTFTPAYPSLQTHGKTVRKFVPPKTRFVQYEQSDEAFCVYAGIAKYSEQPVALWDVREQNGKLLGYTRHDPNVALCRSGSPYHSVRLMEPRRGFSIDRPSMMDTNSVRTVELRTDTYNWSFAPHMPTLTFICWFACLGDAEALARTGWLECIGEDCIDEFAYDLAREAYRKFDARF